VSSTHEHLEHAEHAEHAAHSSFDRRVAVTVAITAALLAGVAMLGHRKHNDTLIHKTVKGQLEVKESNTWAQYQAKRLRQAMAQLQIQTLSRLPRDKGGDADHDPDIAKLKAEVARYDGELKELKEKAEGVQKEVAAANAAADHAHHQADWLDYAHLAVELGLVVCSLGILTKRKLFWLVGMVVTVVGVSLAIYALTMSEHHADSPGHAEESKEAKPSSGGH
jgi:uncharacterized protein YlxW (UPF0749 family)